MKRMLVVLSIAVALAVGVGGYAGAWNWISGVVEEQAQADIKRLEQMVGSEISCDAIQAGGYLWAPTAELINPSIVIGDAGKVSLKNGKITLSGNEVVTIEIDGLVEGTVHGETFTVDAHHKFTVNREVWENLQDPSALKQFSYEIHGLKAGGRLARTFDPNVELNFVKVSVARDVTEGEWNFDASLDMKQKFVSDFVGIASVDPMDSLATLKGKFSSKDGVYGLSFMVDGKSQIPGHQLATDQYAFEGSFSLMGPVSAKFTSKLNSQCDDSAMRAILAHLMQRVVSNFEQMSMDYRAFDESGSAQASNEMMLMAYRAYAPQVIDAISDLWANPSYDMVTTFAADMTLDGNFLADEYTLNVNDLTLMVGERGMKFVGYATGSKQKAETAGVTVRCVGFEPNELIGHVAAVLMRQAEWLSPFVGLDSEGYNAMVGVYGMELQGASKAFFKPVGDSTNDWTFDLAVEGESITLNGEVAE